MSGNSSQLKWSPTFQNPVCNETSWLMTSNKHAHQCVCPLYCVLEFSVCCVFCTSPIEGNGYRAEMMSRTAPPWRDGSPELHLPQAEPSCLEYNIWFSPSSANDSSPPTLIITVRMGRASLVMPTQLMAAAELTAPINPPCFWHQLAGSSQSSLILDCTPPVYRSATINAPSAIKNRRHHKLHDPTWTRSMSLLRWV